MFVKAEVRERAVHFDLLFLAARCAFSFGGQRNDSRRDIALLLFAS